MHLDIGLGILNAIFISWLFELPLSVSMIVWGILFALAPDLDYLIHLARGGTSKDDYKHRRLLHHPLLFLLISIGVFWVFGKTWGLMFLLGTLGHFVHDSIGIGWGVQWLSPFNKNHYSFFYVYSPPHVPNAFPSQLVYEWKYEELDELNQKYGDSNWLRNIYGKMHPFALAESIVFIAAVAGLYLYLK